MSERLIYGSKMSLGLKKKKKKMIIPSHLWHSYVSVLTEYIREVTVNHSPLNHADAKLYFVRNLHLLMIRQNNLFLHLGKHCRQDRSV